MSRLEKSKWRVRRGNPFDAVFEQLARTFSATVLFDMSRSGALSYADAGALIDGITHLQNRPAGGYATLVGMFSLPAKTSRRFARLGLDRLLPTFVSEREAMAHPTIKARRLAGTRAIVLCNDRKSRLAPLSTDTPAARCWISWASLSRNGVWICCNPLASTISFSQLLTGAQPFATPCQTV